MEPSRGGIGWVSGGYATDAEPFGTGATAADRRDGWHEVASSFRIFHSRPRCRYRNRAREGGESEEFLVSRREDLGGYERDKCSSQWTGNWGRFPCGSTASLDFLGQARRGTSSLRAGDARDCSRRGKYYVLCTLSHPVVGIHSSNSNEVRRTCCRRASGGWHCHPRGLGPRTSYPAWPALHHLQFPSVICGLRSTRIRPRTIRHPPPLPLH